MSQVQATQTFFHAAGMVSGGERFDADHPLVAEFAPMFEPVDDDPEPVRRGPGRPPGPRNKPKPTADG